MSYLGHSMEKLDDMLAFARGADPKPKQQVVEKKVIETKIKEDDPHKFRTLEEMGITDENLRNKSIPKGDPSQSNQTQSVNETTPTIERTIERPIPEPRPRNLGLQTPIAEQGETVSLAESPNETLGIVEKIQWDDRGNARYFVKHSDPDLADFSRWYEEHHLHDPVKVAEAQKREAAKLAEQRKQEQLQNEGLQDKKYYDTAFMTNDNAGGWNKPKTQRRLGVEGDNPIAAEHRAKRMARDGSGATITRKRRPSA